MFVQFVTMGIPPVSIAQSFCVIDVSKYALKKPISAASSGNPRSSTCGGRAVREFVLFQRFRRKDRDLFDR